MREFEYRTPRFMASATFRFQMREASVPGLCTNVSLGGVSALIGDDKPAVEDTGTLVLGYSQQQFTLKAVVTHVEGQEVGFSFLQRDDEERSAAADFAAFLEAQVPVSVGLHKSEDSASNQPLS